MLSSVVGAISLPRSSYPTLSLPFFLVVVLTRPPPQKKIKKK